MTMVARVGGDQRVCRTMRVRRLHDGDEKCLLGARAMRLWAGRAPGSPVATAREKGLYRMDGKTCVVKDGDVMLFKFNV